MKKSPSKTKTPSSPFLDHSELANNYKVTKTCFVISHNQKNNKEIKSFPYSQEQYFACMMLCMNRVAFCLLEGKFLKNSLIFTF